MFPYSSNSTSSNRIVRRNNSNDSNVSSELSNCPVPSSNNINNHNVIMRHTNIMNNNNSSNSIPTNTAGTPIMGNTSRKQQSRTQHQRRSTPSLSSSSVTTWLGSALICFMISYLVFIFLFAIHNVTNMLFASNNNVDSLDPPNIRTSNHVIVPQGNTNNPIDLVAPKERKKRGAKKEEPKSNDETKVQESKKKVEITIQESKKKEVTSSLTNNNDMNTNNETAANRGTKDQKRKKKYNIFKKHDLSLHLTHGVNPDVLIPHDSSKEALPIAIKDDIPRENHPTPNNILTAYIEPNNFDEWTIKPLPIRRLAQKNLLTVKTYPRLHSCSKMIQQFPVDDTPVDDDTFLPWIHDVFPTTDGKYVQIVAQNKRRCRNGSFEKDILHKMNPQASLFQHVSVKRVKVKRDKNHTRYKLVPHEEADPDGITTRFICRFKPSMEETLSEFNFLYDWTGYRKRYKASFLEEDAGIKAIHSSQLIFKCPVPKHLQEIIRTGSSVKNDWASLFIDIIPIRTPPRWGSPQQYFPPWYASFQSQPGNKKNETVFDPIAAWGTNHVLPIIEDSGRWENIPICKPSLMTYENLSYENSVYVNETTKEIVPKQQHKLVSCIWASAGYTTRGNRFAINDGQRRLLEWITYNKVIGFDHFYVYDNSGAFGSDTSLKPITDLFLDSNDVTYIPWPAQICNNNPNNVDSVGERSSQYAAEQSCRLRFGPHVDWIGQFDIDEYLVPMGEHKNIIQLLDELDKEDTKIISFSSWRAWPRWAFINEPEPTNDPNVCWHNEPCFELSIPSNYTMLQAYNCDRQKPGQKTEAMPAEKQVYKASYVVSHFVHYSVATILSEKNQTEYEKEGLKWKPRPFPDPRQRFANEVTEALMIHTKAVARQDTAGYERMCHINNTRLPIRRQGLCRLGVPWPETPYVPGTINATKEGRAYNCYVNPQVEEYLVPKLVKELKKHEGFFHTTITDKVAKV